MEFNYQLPIKFGRLMEPNKPLSTCDLKKSIKQNIDLIVTSKYNEHRYDETFGCEIYDMDFELILNENQWREKISNSVIASVLKYETRVENLNTSIATKEEEFVNKDTKVRGIRKKVSIKILANIKDTGENIEMETNLFLSPISAS